MKKIEAESLGAVHTHTHTHTHTIHLENKRINSRKIAENKIAELAIRNKKGITLIALVITIIVLVILVGVSVAMLTGTNGILTQAQKAKMTTELSSYKEQLELYKTEKLSENREFLESTLTVGKESLKYNTQPEGETGNIKTVIPSIKDEYIDKVEIIKGSLLINTQDKNEIEIAKSLGIAANPYDIVNGELLSSNGNLLLMDETGTLTIPDSVTKIGEGAFANLEGLKTIVIPGTVKEIGTNAFAYNKTLETVIMQEGVEKIGKSAFYECVNLVNINMPSTINDIGDFCFGYDKNIEKIEIPESVSVINAYILFNCENLKTINLSKNIKEIHAWAFYGTAFETITLPKSLEQIEQNAFSMNNNLKDIIIEGKTPNYIYENGMLMPKEKNSILFISKSYLKSINTLTIPEGIVNFDNDIGENKNITRLVLPNTLQSIEASSLPDSISEIEVKGDNPKFAISEKDKMLYTKDTKELCCCYSKEKDINLKDESNQIGILKIKSYAFKQAINAKNIILPDSTENIDTLILAYYNGINVEIGKNVSKISHNFNFNNNNGTVTIDSANNYYTIEDNVLYNKDKTELCTVLFKIQGEFKVKDTVKTIGDLAFHSQNYMTKITIPEGVEEIFSSFNSCSSLTEIEIPNSVKSISNDCFAMCNNLSNIKVKQSENSISGAPWGAPKGMKVVNWDS